ncbi:MAG TPA: beta-Ala-His dipeptidase [Candidatus Acidoferrum sp.]|nr:beta-Ala-His dipeptidase [Candidatus Acidoferrum sp.]
MSYVFEGLEPAAVLKYFHELSQIPRVPGEQKRVSDWAAGVGRSLGLETYQDGRQNVLIYKPASPGMEGAPPVAVQSHLDMVCEKEPGVTHDFSKDPLKLRVVGNNKVMATGTTLGADNGVGVAFIMALLADKSLKHPPIEAVFTTDEETDMGGAFGLAYDKLSAKLLINLDAGAVCVCGSGELEVEMTMRKGTEALDRNALTYTLSVDGLIGGHTGANAMIERGNAIILLNRVLIALDKEVKYQTLDMQGGAGMSSAFARNAKAVIGFAPAELARAMKVVDRVAGEIKGEMVKRDPDIAFHFLPCPTPPKEAFDAHTANRLRTLLAALPDGVFSLNHDFKGAMESCSNVGVVETREKELFVTILIRATVPGKKYYLYDKVVHICEALDIAHRIGRDLPHWEYNMSDDVKALIRELYPEHEMGISQGTLECGIFTANMPGACVVALGSPYYYAHSPNEYFLLDETRLYWQRFLTVLERLGERKA